MKKSKANLLKKIHGGQVCQIVSTTARLGLPDLLKDKDQSLSFLAKALVVEEPALHRLLSALVALHLIEEHEGLYRLTEEGRYLVSDEDESLHAIAVYKGSPLLWKAYGKMYEGIKGVIPPFELAYGKDLFSYLEDHPEDGAIFQNAMASYEQQSSKKILDLYDFSPLKSFLDVGGGLGTFAKTIMKLCPSISGAVFDLPSVIGLIQDEQMTGIAGDFFKSIPQGYDAYILRNILHDWSDDRCLEILKNIRTSCSPHSRLLIFETFYQRDHESRLGKFSDLTMFTLTPGGKNRSREEIETLVENAGFSILNIYQSTSSKSLLECAIYL